MSVMVLQGRKSSPQKSRPPESGHRRHGVWIAIEYSYKLGQKNNLNSCAYQIQSHIYMLKFLQDIANIATVSPLLTNKDP